MNTWTSLDGTTWRLASCVLLTLSIGPLLQVALAARVPQASYIAAPAASWLDDFLAWISPEIPRCCRAFPMGDRCPPPDQPPCNASAAACADCTACFRAAGPPGGDLLVGGRPSMEQVPPLAAHVRLCTNHPRLRAQFPTWAVRACAQLPWSCRHCHPASSAPMAA